MQQHFKEHVSVVPVNTSVKYYVIYVCSSHTVQLRRKSMCKLAYADPKAILTALSLFSTVWLPFNNLRKLFFLRCQAVSFVRVESQPFASWRYLLRFSQKAHSQRVTSPDLFCERIIFLLSESFPVRFWTEVAHPRLWLIVAILQGLHRSLSPGRFGESRHGSATIKHLSV